ncbi:MAG: TlpA disulfide reductase family protein [Acidimicrobiia bacterium]
MEAPDQDELAAASAPPSAPPSAPRPISLWLGLGAVVLGGLIVTNVMLLQRVGDLQDQIDIGFTAVDGDVSSLENSLGGVADMVDDFEAQLDDINALALAGSGEASAAPAPATQIGTGLPRFDPSVQDPALGARMAGLTGPEYYSGQTLEVNAADGTARAWLVWAHWCPYCQEEMPELKAWVEANATTFPNFEIVSVTTSMDESRGNPLVPYLDELQLPFPVIVDNDGSLANQLGLNAFPFWVFTGPDGTVLGRSAGLLGPERFASIFRQLQDIAAA